MTDVVPGGWSRYKIKDVADRRDRYSFTGGPFGSNLKSEEYTQSGVRIIQLQNIGDGEFRDKYKIYTSEKKADELLSCNIFPNDIILSKMGDPVARAAIIPSFDNRYLMASDGIRLAIDKDNFDTKFVHDTINFDLFRRQAELNSTGSTRKRIGLTELRELTFIAPPLPEQKKIASILTAVDEVIEKTESQIAKLQDLKTGMMQELLTKGIGHTEFKDSPVGRIPLGWECLKLEALLANVPSPMRSGPFGSALLKDELVSTGIPFLGIDNVHIERFSRSYKRFVTVEKFEKLSRYAVRAKDVMVTIMGTVGRCCVVPDNAGDALSSKHVWTISLEHNRYIPELLCWQINYADWVNKQFANESQGGVMDSISSKTLKNLLLPVPPIEEQRSIAQVHLALSQKIARTIDKAHQLGLLKKALMQDLLTGKVRVKTD